MKIGVLTFQCANNYGAVLQAYALQEYLIGQGHEVEVIDYEPEYITRLYNQFFFPKLGGLSLYGKIRRLGYWIYGRLKKLPLIPFLYKRQKIFESFARNSLNLSKKCYFDVSEFDGEYDAIFFGSDQIWNPKYTNNGDDFFLGNFKTGKRCLKIAYAASAGPASKTLGALDKFTASLGNFDSISVRESELSDALQPFTDKKIGLVLDPTLLVDPEVFHKIALRPREEKYVLVYQVSYLRETDIIARDLAKQLGAKVVTIWAGFKCATPFSQDMAATPQDFVGLFKYAACVVSTSFHGTAFSVLFNKDFYYVSNANAGENRARQILSPLGLMDRFIDKGARPRFSKIDWERINGEDKISGLKKSSRDFIASALLKSKSVLAP